MQASPPKGGNPGGTARGRRRPTQTFVDGDGEGVSSGGGRPSSSSSSSSSPSESDSDVSTASSSGYDEHEVRKKGAYAAAAGGELATRRKISKVNIRVANMHSEHSGADTGPSPKHLARKCSKGHAQMMAEMGGGNGLSIPRRSQMMKNLRGGDDSNNATSSESESLQPQSARVPRLNRKQSGAGPSMMGGAGAKKRRVSSAGNSRSGGPVELLSKPEGDPHALENSGRSVSLPQLQGGRQIRDPGARPGTLKVRRILEELRVQRMQLATNQSTDIGDRDFGEMEAVRDALRDAKLRAANDIAAIGDRVAVESVEVKTTILALIDDMMKEGDVRPGNAELVHSIINHIATIDFTAIVLAKQLHFTSCKLGYHRYLKSFLGVPFVVESLTLQLIKEMVVRTVKLKKNRCAMLLVVLQMTTRSEICKEEAHVLDPIMQESFELAISMQFASNESDSHARAELIHFFVSHPFFDLDTAKESSDKQTIFSRAAREGDTTLLGALLKKRLVENINRVQSDGTNALMQAAARDHVGVVKLLCSHPKIKESLQYVYPNKGTAIQIAVALKRDPEIVNTLKQKMKDLKIDDKSIAREKAAAAAAAAAQKNAGGDPAAGDQQQTDGGGGVSKARKRSFRKKNRGELEEKIHQDSVDGTSQLKVLVASLRPLYEQIDMALKGSEGALDFKKVRDIREHLIVMKGNFIQKLLKIGGRIEIRKAEVTTSLLNIMDQIFREADATENNPQLVEALFGHVLLPFSQMAIERNWIVASAESGSAKYLDMLLNCEGMAERLEGNRYILKIIEAAAASRMYRCTALLALLSEDDPLGLREANTDIVRQSNIWQKITTEIASNQTASVQEVRKDRIELLKTILADAELFGVNVHSLEGADRQTIFSRAAVEGDGELLAMLLNYFCTSNNRILNRPDAPVDHHADDDEEYSSSEDDGAATMNANRIQSDGTTALMQAVLKSKEDAVERLVHFQDITRRRSSGNTSSGNLMKKRGSRFPVDVRACGGEFVKGKTALELACSCKASPEMARITSVLNEAAAATTARQ